MLHNFEDYRWNSYFELSKNLIFVVCLLCWWNWPGFMYSVAFIPSMKPALQKLLSQFWKWRNWFQKYSLTKLIQYWSDRVIQCVWLFSVYFYYFTTKISFKTKVLTLPLYVAYSLIFNNIQKHWTSSFKARNNCFYISHILVVIWICFYTMSSSVQANVTKIP